jgi:hypothetical protein
MVASRLSGSAISARTADETADMTPLIPAAAHAGVLNEADVRRDLRYRL